MNAINYLCWAAKEGAGKTNYVFAVRAGAIIGRGPDLRDALNQDARGSTLYSLYEPSTEELILASNAGVVAVYFALSKNDAVRRGVVSLRAEVVRCARETILKEYPCPSNSSDPPATSAESAAASTTV